MATYKVEIDGGIETVTARTEKEAIRKAARKQGNSKSVGKTFGPKVKVTKIKEELNVSDGMDTWIKDFQKSDAPQFKGKTKEERREMAIAAYMSAKRGGKPQNESVDEGYESFTKKAVETGKVKTGASKSRIATMQKQDDNRPTLRKNEGKKMDSAAMKKAMDVFRKRGGKITKVAPGKAAGYHGKDDPGKGMHGMMDRGDTKGMPRKKKIRSMR
jgi:hypothetical protein